MLQHLRLVLLLVASVATVASATTSSKPSYPMTVTATFSSSALSPTVQGTISLTQANASYPAVGELKLNFTSATSLSSSNGSKYHVHTAMPATSCSEALGHYDPLNSGRTCTPADLAPNAPSLCEMGDLSGKHGNIAWSVAAGNRYSYTIDWLDRTIDVSRLVGRVGLGLGLFSSCALLSSYLISSPLISSHLTSSHPPLLSSHLISSHLI